MNNSQPNDLEPLFGLIVFIGFIGFIVFLARKYMAYWRQAHEQHPIPTITFKNTPSQQTREEPKLYMKQDWFFSSAERSFFGVLEQIVDLEKYRIFAKVRLADVFYVRKGLGKSERTTAQNKINHKHIDFILYTADTIQPVCAIELDDSSHSTRNRIERDDFVDQAFKSAELPLLRIPVAHTYNPHKLVEKLSPFMQISYGASTEPPLPEVEADKTPFCPKCSAKMVVRKVKHGRNQGQTFWGCPNYPNCRGMLPF